MDYALWVAIAAMFVGLAGFVFNVKTESAKKEKIIHDKIIELEKKAVEYTTTISDIKNDINKLFDARQETLVNVTKTMERISGLEKNITSEFITLKEMIVNIRDDIKDIKK